MKEPDKISDKRYTDLNTYFRSMFGCRVHKITVDAGLSCPNIDGNISTSGCIYCNTRGSGTGAFAKGISVKEQISTGKKAVARRFKAKKFIIYFQSFTNTYAPFQNLKSLYETALAVEDVIGLSIGTRPDCVGPEILDLLQSYTNKHMIWLEYGLQSAHDATLKTINRGHDFECFAEAVKTTKNRGIKICAHVVLGLPEETREHIMETANILAGMGIDGIKIHLLYVIKGTPLAEMHRNGSYKCLAQQEYADLVCDFLERLPQEMVIQRLTSEPHPQELVAPAWALNKADTSDLIKERLMKEIPGRERNINIPDRFKTKYEVKSKVYRRLIISNFNLK